MSSGIREKARKEDGVVFILDDDEVLRDSISDLVQKAGLVIRCFGSAAEFLQSDRPNGLNCMVLDPRMPGVNGLELLTDFTERGIAMPVVIVTSYGDIEMAVNALRLGAIDFIEKPFRVQRLWESICKALKTSGEQASRLAKRKEFSTALATLTPKEKQVVKFMLEGNSDKEIALLQEVTRRAIAFHRNAILKKMGFGTVVEMALTLAKLEIIEL